MAIAVIALALVATPSFAGVKIIRDAHNNDRPGGDVQRTVLQRADSELCVRQCVADRRCASYTYVRPGVQDKQAVCYLKNTVRPIVKNTCCESGRKVAVQDPPRPTRPTRIEPPETINKQFCNTAAFCANRKPGRWNDSLNSCDCDTP